LQETEGNPLFIIELMQTLTPEAIKQEGAWPLPRTIQTVIQSRLARLSKTTQQVMAAAAVLGRTFTDGMLCQVAELSLKTTLQAIDEAAAANLITEQAAAAYDFTHDKIRAVLLDSLTQSRRRHLHLRIAAALEATLSNDFGLLSYHFESGGDLLRARSYGLRAARQAVELYADEDALRWYHKVEALLESTQTELSPEAIPKVIPFQQAHVSRTLPLDLLGLIYRQCGLIRQRIGQYDQAEADFQAALERGRSRSRLDEQTAAHNLLSFLAYLRSDYDGVGRHAQQALDLATQAGQAALRGPGLRHLGISVYRTGDYDRALALYQEALAAYRQANDRLGMAGVYNNIGFVRRTQARYAKAIAAFQEALAIYEETGQVEGIALIHSNIGRTYAFSGDLAQARQHLQQGLVLSQEARTDWITVKIHRTMGNVLAQVGQWPQALHQAHQAQRLAQTLGSDEDLGATFRLLAEIASAWPESNLDHPTTYFEQSIAILQQVGAQDELERAQAAFAAYRTSTPRF
jgi:tetratricopeptide (TPR) repeat protein